MDRRGVRVVLVLAVAAVPALVVLAPRANPHGQDAAARNVGDPSAFVPGSSSFDGIHPTHIPGSSTWDDILAVPTGSPSSAAGPRPTKKPGHSGAPTLTGSPGPTLGPTSNPTLGPTFAPSANPVAPPTAKPTVVPTQQPTTAPPPPPTPKPTPNPVACTLFPSDNVWNRRVDALPVRA